MHPRRLSLILLAGLLLAACGSEEAPAPQPAAAPTAAPAIESAAIPEYPIEDFMGSTAYTGASFSPNGSRILVSHNRSGIYNVYALAADGSGEEQLTDSDTDATLAVSYFPEDERFIYTADQGGNELNHLYVRELDGSEVDLTPDNLIWGVHLYLQPQYSQSYKFPGDASFPTCEYTYSSDVASQVPRQWFWRLMNNVCSNRYIERFKGAHYLKEQCSLEWH